MRPVPLGQGLIRTGYRADEESIAKYCVRTVQHRHLFRFLRRQILLKMHTFTMPKEAARRVRVSDLGKVVSVVNILHHRQRNVTEM